MTEIDQRSLGDLEGIGKAMLRDFGLLGIESVPQLAEQEADELYERLGAITGQRQDPCVHDVFACAIAQARDSELSSEERKWWTWSRKRKAARGV